MTVHSPAEQVVFMESGKLLIQLCVSAYSASAAWHNRIATSDM